MNVRSTANVIDLAVLACLGRNMTTGNHVTLGVRRIAEEIGKSRNTVSKSIRRLRSAGSIKQVTGTANQTHADTWRLLHPEEINVRLGLDPWSWHGLGVESQLVFSWVSQRGPVSELQIREHFQFGRTIARKIVNTLHSASLLEASRLGHSGNRTRTTAWVAESGPIIDEHLRRLIAMSQASRREMKILHDSQRNAWRRYVHDATNYRKAIR